MKKLFAVWLFLLLPFSMFAKDDAEMYWEEETDVNGQLLTYYLVKTDEQLSHNLDYFIQSLTGIKYNTYMPNTSILKKQMVSKEYLESKHPRFYRHFFDDDSDESSRVNWEGYRYCFTGLAYSDEMGLICLLKRNGDKVYMSMAMYASGGRNWIYTNQFLELLENSLDAE